MSYPVLLSSLRVGPTTYPSRIAMAPMTRARAGSSMMANELMAKYYSQRASAGLIFTEATSISIQGRGWFDAPEIRTEAQADAWRQTTDAVHAAGGRIFCQLWHAGRASHSSFRDGIEGFEGNLRLAVAPSAIKRISHTGKQYYTPLKVDPEIETPRALRTEEIAAVVKDFRNAAEMAKRAGFDGVELHAANGYLLDAFLQSCSNERSDQYGGSLENRFRILQEVLEEVLQVYPSNMVSVRISPNGSYNGMGSQDFREAFLYYAERLKEFNLGFLHILVGLDFGFHELGTAMTLADFRKVYPGKIMGNCGFTLETAEREVADGNADMIAFGRLYISNPDLVKRVETGAALAELPDKDVWYSTPTALKSSEGYTDFQTMEQLAN